MQLSDFKDYNNPIYLDTINYIITHGNSGWKTNCIECPFNRNNAIDGRSCWEDKRYRRSTGTCSSGYDLILINSAKQFKHLLEEEQMNRIDIRKSYKDGKLRVYIDGEYTVIHLLGNPIYNGLIMTIYEKDNRLLTLAQANTILAPFGYELYQSTDWTKVEVGSKLKFTDGRSQYETTFYDYVEQTNQVIVMESGLVKVYNESEVELI